VEASALQAPVALNRQRSTIGLAVLRLRSDEQLVALLRSGHEEAFQVIHDRYRQRLFAYVRQMLPVRQDAEDALQEVFERAYASLSAGDRDLALRPWLYRIAHNRCIDHLRRPTPPPPEAMLQIGSPPRDPVIEADCREALRRLIADVRRLPEQQRSALLMRELGGISYADVAQALGVTIPAVKSLLVRARVSLAAAGEARDTACEEIRAELVMAHESRVRPNSMARRHLRDCPGCREFRGHLRGVRRSLLAAAPLGPFGLLTRLLGGGGTGGAAGGGAAAACTGASASGVAGTGGVLASAGAVVSGAGHVATLLAATVVTASGAAAITHTTLAAPHHAPAHHPRAVSHASAPPAAAAGRTIVSATAPASPASLAPAAPAPAPPSHANAAVAVHTHRVATPAGAQDQSLGPIPDPISQPVQLSSDPSSPATPKSGTPTPATPGTPTGTPTSGTPTPTGGTTGPQTGTGTPTPGSPTPAGGSGGTPTPSGGSPSPGSPAPGSGGTTTPSSPGSGTPTTSGTS
jgi:RNA polymerase sigma factor (sigma-70 family)